MEKILLVVLDGWGLRKEKNGNAIKLAKTPNFDFLWKNYPHTTLKTWGEYVGLPKGTLGGSEVGHLHIGAGRIVKQKLTQINESIRDKSFFRKKPLVDVLKKCKKENSSLHVMGLLSDAGVHSDIKHLFAILKAAKIHDVKNVKVHCFLDGRDTPPKSAGKYIRELKKEIKRIGIGEISTISGRYYAMDRDKRWSRTKKAFEAIVEARGMRVRTPLKALREAYKRGETDEFVKPTVIGQYTGLKNNDGIILFNFRADRMRQLTKLLLKVNKNIVSMTEYSKDLKTKVLFKPTFVNNSLGEILSKNNLKQLRIAESEKGPHVTYFFNGEREEPFKNENRIILPSPKVATYDLKPEMSAFKITKKLLNVFEKYDFILLNFANGDMVGHTGVLKAAIKGVEAVDGCIGKIVDEMKDYMIIITADHGNCENMMGKFKTSHTFNKVPFILVNDKFKGSKLRSGSLYNIAPTILKMMKLKKPKEMDRSLFK